MKCKKALSFILTLAIIISNICIMQITALAAYDVTNNDEFYQAMMVSAEETVNINSDFTHSAFWIEPTINKTVVGKDGDTKVTINGCMPEQQFRNAVTVTFRNLKFYNCTKMFASSVAGSKIIFENCEIDTAWNFLNGAFDGDLIFRNCTFTNYACVGWGGAIYSSGSGTITIENCTFNGGQSWTSGETAGRGGAICVFNESANLIITDSTFSNHYASGQGGAIYSNCATTITDSTFSYNGTNAENKVPNGGAICVDGALTINGCTFTGNTAGAEGGAVYAGGVLTVGKSVTKNNIFNANAAGTAGGAIRAAGSGATVSNATFTDNNGGNVAGGAIASWEIASLALKNVTMSGNIAPTGGAILVNTAPITVDGKVTINGNYGDAEKTWYSNLFLSTGETISVGAEFDVNSVIWLTTGTTPTVGAPVNITVAGTPDYSANFIGDSGNYGANYDSENEIIQFHEHAYSEATCSAAATCSVCGATTGEALEHTYSNEWTSDGTNHWHAATCGHDVKSDEGACSGGTATCSAKAECETCGNAYGDFADHTYSNEWSKDETGHWYAATCEHTTEKNGFASHTPNVDAATEETAKYCIVCNYEIEAQLEHIHTYSNEWTSDGTKHWHAATCGHDVKSDEGACSGGTATCSAKAECETCGNAYGDFADHTYSNEWTSDGTKHWHAATCAHDVKRDEGTCSGGTATCTEQATCGTCENKYGSALGHNYTEKVEDAAHLKETGADCQTGNVYWYDCSRCDANAKNDAEADDKYYTSETNFGAHDYSEKVEDASHLKQAGADCETGNVYWFDCANCDTISAEDTFVSTTNFGEDHTYSNEWTSDGTNHWHAATCAHTSEKSDVGACSGGTATTTEKAVCTTCNNEYGDLLTPAPTPIVPSTPKVEEKLPADADGDMDIDNPNASAGQTVTVTVTPDKYYKVEKVIVTDSNGNEIVVEVNEDGTYSFEMPAGSVTVEPVFEWDNPFEDVDEEVYYAPAVEWALKNEITVGTGDDTFSPNAACSRAQMATLLWRAAGCPEPSGTASNFADVDGDAYYAKAVLWAVEKGITSGTGADTFSPDEECTRAQMATFLFRLAKGIAPAGAEGFEDIAADAYYADAVIWAAANGITSGTGNGAFSPDSDCTRGQMVTFLYRYFVK